jgi:hypothetical protein
MAKSNTINWFRKVRGSYLPSSFVGLVIYLAYVAYIVAIGLEWYASGQGYWTLLTVVVPLVAFSTLVVQYIASRHAK